MLLTHTHTHRSNKRNDTHRHTEVRQGVGDAANTHPYTQIYQTKGTIHTGIQRSDRASGMLLTHTHTHRSNKRNDTHRHTEVRQGVGDAANTHPYTQIKQKERYTQAYRSDRASGMLLTHTHTHRSNKRNDTHRHTEVRQGVGDAANTHPYTQIKQKERYTQAYRGQTGRRGCC